MFKVNSLEDSIFQPKTMTTPHERSCGLDPPSSIARRNKTLWKIPSQARNDETDRLEDSNPARTSWRT